jgi:peptide/nickel transport system substrate-binding protein
MNFAGGVDPADNSVWFLSEQVGRLNWSRFADKNFDSLHVEGLAEEDPARRDAVYRRMQDIMEESGGFKFLTHGLYAAAHSSAVRPCILADGFQDYARAHRSDSI